MVAACSYAPSRHVPDAPVGVECDWSFSPTQVDPCVLDPDPAMVLTPGIWTYNTDTGELADPNSTKTMPSSIVVDGTPPIRVLSLAGLEIQTGATLVATGAPAFAIVVDGNLVIAGAIDISATLVGSAQTPGPGASDTACADGLGQDGANAAGTDGGGGGGGGGFGAPGGAGGMGGTDVGQKAAAGPGGNAVAATPSIRGGCRGGTGGKSNTDVGLPGVGGGGLLVAAKDSIAVMAGGEIRSAGTGALNGGFNSGGPGGGSGGLIWLETPTLVNGGLLCANGGGGAGGSADATLGGRGDDAMCSTTAVATGGTGGSANSRGGVGGVADMPAGDGVANVGDNDGGGGGGGSIGVIVLRAMTMMTGSGAASPTPVTLGL